MPANAKVTYTSNPLLDELKVLQYCAKRKIKLGIEAVDYFEEGGRAYLVCKHDRLINLRQYA